MMQTIEATSLCKVHVCYDLASQSHAYYDHGHKKWYDHGRTSRTASYGPVQKNHEVIRQLIDALASSVKSARPQHKTR